jgi:lantibiotic modifying enzyme
VAALVVLEHVLGNTTLLEVAVQLGDALIARAQKMAEGWSWVSPGWKNHHNLTALSHGTSGCAYAFLELFEATGEQRFCDAALSAFRYERTWFSVAARNWPDFREEPRERRRNRADYPCLSFWCHGAPGIALARLRAFELLKDETVLASSRLRKKGSGPPKNGDRLTKNQQLAALSKCRKRVFPQTARG